MFIISESDDGRRHRKSRATCYDYGDRVRCAVSTIRWPSGTRATGATVAAAAVHGNIIRGDVSGGRGGGGCGCTFKGADGARGTEAAAAAAVASESGRRRRRCAPGPLPAAAVGGDTRPRPQPAIGAAARGRFAF